MRRLAASCATPLATALALVLVLVLVAGPVPAGATTATAPVAGGATAAAAPGAVVKVALTPDGVGGYLLRGDGTVTALGAAAVLGPAPTLANGESAATMAATAHGYLVFSDRGRVFAYGDARSAGDLAGVPLNGPIVDAALTADGGGYWLLGTDGGVFSFGNARFAGSTGDLRLNSPAIGLVPDPDGDGYLFVAGDGGVFAFSAPFRGSMGATRLNRPVVGMIPFGAGYLMVGSDGGVFTFSDRPFLGSLGDQPGVTATEPITSIAAGGAGDWYVLARRDGAVYAFGPGTPTWARTTTPGAGNPTGTAAVPAEAQAVDTSHPDHVVGNGTPGQLHVGRGGRRGRRWAASSRSTADPTRSRSPWRRRPRSATTPVPRSSSTAAARSPSAAAASAASST